MSDPWDIDKEKHKNWLRSVYGLKCLKKYLDVFLDREAGVFHRLLKVSLNLGRKKCTNNCSFKDWKPRANQLPPLECEVCTPWRDLIWAKHVCKHGRVFWVNSKPCLWYKDKWEVAKVYMPEGHTKHKSVCDFDIVALLVFMTQCQHFEDFGLKPFCEKVINFRNGVMHSANYELEQAKLYDYLNRIKDLGNHLEEDFPEFGTLSQDIDEIQNRDFTLIFPMSMEAETAMGDSDKCSTMELLNTLKGIMTDEEIENLLFAAVQKSSRVPGRKASARREERRPQPQHQDDDSHCGAAAADTQNTVDQTWDSLKMNMTRLTKRIAEVKDPPKNMHERAEEAHHSQQSSHRELAVPQTKISKAEDKLIDFFAKTYVTGESLCKALDSDEEEEEEEESKQEEPEMKKLPNMFSMLVASAMAIAKTIVDEDS